MKKFILATLIAIIINKAYSAEPHIYCLHINGINTNWLEAQENTDKLKKLMDVNSNMVTFGLVWNPTKDYEGKNFWNDLSDVMLQKVNEKQVSLTLDDFTEFWIKENNLPNYPKDSEDYKKLKSEISIKYEEALSKSAGSNFDTIVDRFHEDVPLEFKNVVQLINNPVKNVSKAKSYDTLSTFNDADNKPKIDLSFLEKDQL